MIKTGTLLALFLLTPIGARAQTFSSGSTGADGALTLSPCEGRSVQVPDSGVFNFTTVTIPGCAAGSTTLVFIPNQRNTPVTILAQGSVVIDVNGVISVDA